jgi:hypothetical protein
MCSLPKQEIIEQLNLDDEDIYYSSWCDKIGGKIWWYSNGGCEDMYLPPIDITKDHKKKFKNKRNRYENKLYEKKKLKKLSNNVWWATWDKGGYLKRSWFATNTRRHYKKYSNKKIRRYEGELPKKGNGCHRLFDYWWQIW